METVHQHLQPPQPESIHSGQFMVSHFEAEEQDDEDNVAVPIPEVTGDPMKAIVPAQTVAGIEFCTRFRDSQQLAIDTSLSKLFQCMSLAYRQKLTSPKWNRFRGIRLRWKDKIRLNNVIWRCWHLQFIRKENTLICQFASPLDVDTHNKPEAVVLEGKYWKRKLAAVTAEYKKWRMFYRNHVLGHTAKDSIEMLNDMDVMAFDPALSENMMVDEDYMGLMSDTLFSTISNQPFVFPDSREIAKAGLADFIQPSLGPLQPNLDDYMDTLDPFQELMSSRLPPVPEEQSGTEHLFKNAPWSYLDNPYHQQMQPLQQLAIDSKPTVQLPQEHRHSSSMSIYQDIMLHQQQQLHPFTVPPDPPPYSGVISKGHQKSKGQYNRYQQHQQQQHNQPIIMNVIQDAAQSSVMNQTQFKLEPAEPFKIPTDSRQQQPQQSQGYKFPAPSSNPPNIKFTSQQQQPQSQQAQTQKQAQQTQSQQQVVQMHHHHQYSPQGGYLSSSSHPSHLHQQQFHHHNFQPIHSPNSSSTSSTTSNTSSNQSDKVESRRRGAPRGRQRSRSNTREPIKRPPLISAVSDPQLLNPTNSVLLTQLLTGRDPPSQAYSRSLSTSNLKEEKTPIPILPQTSSNTTTLIIQPLAGDPLSLNTFSNSNSPITDPSAQSLNSPTSSQGSIGSPNRDTQRDRRAGHIHAEQKRRYNIKNGFDMIHSLIPHLNQNPNAKLSKAAMLQKGAEYIVQLRAERNQLKEEMDSLRQQIETLNSSISNCQSMLPATGAPVSRRRDSKMQELFDQHVRTRTMDNWKYWIFSLIFRPLLNTFNNIVSTTSLDDLYSTTMIWVEQHCTLVDLRPVVLNSLTNMCTITDVLSEPEKLPEEARQMVQRYQPQNQ